MKKSIVSAVMRELNARRNKKLTSEQRIDIALKGAKGRWKNHQKLNQSKV